MNYVYDLLCNFSLEDEFLDFYEWMESDNICTIEKIPIFYISSLELQDILYSTIQVSKEFLNQIYQKTITTCDTIPYSCLITDFQRVVAIKFHSNGLSNGKSSLLIDEEDAIVDECRSLQLHDFSYTIIDKKYSFDSLTREDRAIKKFLLSELKKLYELKFYDEIEYLYYEIFSQKVEKKEMYQLLVNSIEKSFSIEHHELYQIVKMLSDGLTFNEKKLFYSLH